MRRKLGGSWSRLDDERSGMWWRVWGLLKDELRPMVTGVSFCKEEAWEAYMQVLAEQPRRRT